MSKKVEQNIEKKRNEGKQNQRNTLHIGIIGLPKQKLHRKNHPYRLHNCQINLQILQEKLTARICWQRPHSCSNNVILIE